MKTYTTFIEPEDLVKHLDDPQLVIIDCRFDLSNPAWGYQDYLKNHIPDAIYADLEKDLSGQVNENTGRHPLPDPNEFFEICSEWGIDHTKQVIVYDTTFGSFASRLWWMLNYFGHNHVAILEGGFTAWLAAGFPSLDGVVKTQSSKFIGTPDNNLLVTTPTMETLINLPNYAVIDARAEERYSGLEEPIDKKAGHIPNAINFFHGNNLDSQGRLLPVQELRKKYSSLLSNISEPAIVLYCGSGVTSCLNFAVLQHIGIKPIQLYVGSWSEWITNPDHPIVTKVSQ